MIRSGCRLVEVGTTNRTRLSDFEENIGSRGALILKAHTSNFSVVGFTEMPSQGSLAKLAQRHSLLFVIDLGSGALVDLGAWDLPREPIVR